MKHVAGSQNEFDYNAIQAQHNELLDSLTSAWPGTENNADALASIEVLREALVGVYRILPFIKQRIGGAL